jgi:valyl-tRNA synthetase
LLARLEDGDDVRIFEAVVRPQRGQFNGDPTAEIKRLEQEITRAQSMLSNKRFVSRAPDEVVSAEREKLERYRQELDVLRG